MTNIKMKKRSKVTGVTVDLVDPNGKPRTVKIDPKVNNALFWDDKSVLEILAPFYEKHSSEMTGTEFIALFGTIGKKIAGTKKKITITKDVIEQLWEEEDDNGESLSMLSKTLLCGVEGP